MTRAPEQERPNPLEPEYRTEVAPEGGAVTSRADRLAWVVSRARIALCRPYTQPWFWLLSVCLAFAIAWRFYPDDKSPKGAYYRVTSAVNSGRAEDLFPYLETEAQHAAFTIGKYHRESRELIARVYPEPQRSLELGRLGPSAEVEPGPPLFAWYAQHYGWITRLRRDLSGISSIEIEGDRATVQTQRGTRYPFRRRDNGIWGLTLFTARLVADAEKAARDFAQIQAAAEDYAAAKP